jgi:outer membrane protein assembly factor BamB
MKRLTTFPMPLQFVLAVALLTTSCDTFKDKVVLSGKRETVLTIDTTLTPDSSVSELPIIISPKQNNVDWPMAGGTPSHVMPNLTLADPLNLTWATSIGSGSSEDHRLTSGPVTGNKMIFACDATGVISAIDSKSGVVRWSFNSMPEGQASEAIGGGVAYDSGVAYAATAYGELLAVQADNGKIIWRKSLGAPSRIAPTVKEGTVYALTINNEIHALSAGSGATVWTHTGISEAAGILGGASPAVAEGVVVTAYSSGEVFAFHQNTGQPIWGDLINPALRIDSVASIAHIRARPVIYNGVVYIISHGGQMVALDLKTGNRLWQRDIGSIRSPALMGDSLFVITNGGDLACLKLATGHIQWASALPRLDNDKKPILWAGPVIANDSLVLAGSQGQLLFASLKDGKIVKSIEMSAGTSLSPIIADGALYILAENGNLLKYSSEKKE